MMPRTIRGLILLTGGLVSILTALLGAATYYFANKSMVDQLNARITLESRALIAVGRNDGIAGLAAAIRAREAQPSVGNLGYIVVDACGRRLAGSLRAAVPPARYRGSMTYLRADGDTAEAQSLNSPIPGGGRLVVAADRSIVDDADGTVLILFGTAFGLILLFGGGSALIVGRIVKSRLAGIAATAEAIMAGDLSRRMPVATRSGEFDQVAAVINRMLDRIERSARGAGQHLRPLRPAGCQPVDARPRARPQSGRGGGGRPSRNRENGTDVRWADRRDHHAAGGERHVEAGGCGRMTALTRYGLLRRQRCVPRVTCRNIENERTRPTCIRHERRSSPSSPRRPGSMRRN
ncbi:HAMP domain-containing protein [Sphingomonas sp. MAH-6]|nr:HAMP domain-containing protein [Sphingomonas chungangi]